MAIPTAVAVKAKTAKQMALFGKAMQKTDWDGVNNAMTKIKDFGASASIVQETMGDIADLGDSLKTLALGDLMAKISEKAGELYEALEPFAIMIGNILKQVDLSKLDKFIESLKIFNILIENSDRALKLLLDWLIPILEWLFGAAPRPGAPTPPDTFQPPPNLPEGF